VTRLTVVPLRTGPSQGNDKNLGPLHSSPDIKQTLDAIQLLQIGEKKGACKNRLPATVRTSSLSCAAPHQTGAEHRLVPRRSIRQPVFALRL